MDNPLFRYTVKKYSSVRKMEKKLNKMAAKGWRVVSVLEDFFSDYVVIFERPNAKPEFAKPVCGNEQPKQLVATPRQMNLDDTTALDK